MYCIQSVGGRRKRFIVHFDRLKPCDANTRFDNPGSTSSGLEDNNAPHSSTVADLPVMFGRQLHLVEDNAPDSPSQTRRYPDRHHQRPNRYGVPITH